VRVGTGVAVRVGVRLAVPVAVAVGAAVGVDVGRDVLVAVGVLVRVEVAVRLGVDVAVDVQVVVGVAVQVAVRVNVRVAVGVLVRVRVGEGGIGVAVGGAAGLATHCACQLNWDEPADGAPPLVCTSSAKHEPPGIDIAVNGNTQLFFPTAIAHRLGVSAYVRSIQDWVPLGMLVLTRRPTS
jgi:hypothetical protein